MARPRKEIDKKDFEALLSLQCSLEEVTSFFDLKLGGCSEDTIERWCKRTYKKSFADIAPIIKARGKISLRRNQFQLSTKSAAMAIWLGRQYLDQTDHTESGVTDKSDPMHRARELLEDVPDALDKAD